MKTLLAVVFTFVLMTTASAQCWRGNECRAGDYECIRRVMKWEPCAHHQADGRGQPYVDARRKRQQAQYRYRYNRMWRAPARRAACGRGMLC